MRRFIALLAGLLIAASASTASAADSPSWDEEWVPPYQTQPYTFGYIGIDSTPSEQLLSFPSYFVSIAGSQETVTSVNTCSSAKDPVCANWYFQQARSTLVPCDASITMDCLLGIEVWDPAGRPVNVTPLANMVQPDPQAFNGDPAVGLATGGLPSVYSIPGAKHDGGDLYLVKADLFSHRNMSATKFDLMKFEAAIMPVRLVPTNDPNSKMPQISTEITPYQSNVGVVHGGGGGSCKDFFDGKYCFLRQAFPEGFKFGLRVRLHQSDIGWLHGRMQDPSIDVQSVSGGVELTIAASPVRLPIVYGTIPYTQAPPEILKDFEAIPHWGAGWGDRYGPLSGVFMVHNHMDAAQWSFNEVRNWLAILSDKSAAEPSMWFIQTMPGLSGAVGRCGEAVQGLAGLVTTNAAMYLPGPPTFDAASGTLSYQVLAPHYTHNGDVFRGNYNLTLNSKVARCIYGFSSAPVQAVVSVVGASGDAIAATTVVNESGGFLYMSANGFTFSAPTINVKLMQQAPATAVPVARKAITCVKGKQRKSVAAAKCPRGWKRA